MVHTLLCGTFLSNAAAISDPLGGAARLQNRPSGTELPDWLTMAAPFTPFFANGSVNTGAVLPIAKLFKERLGITAVWVMGAQNACAAAAGPRADTGVLAGAGMRGQFDAMTVPQRKLVAEAWVAAGKATGLWTMIQCGAAAIGEAVELAAHAESIGADAIGSLGPFEELCVFSLLLPVDAARF
eukprot:SAG11_NODE_2471_length_3319_cov_3.418634_3_plen_184_part_00